MSYFCFWICAFDIHIPDMEYFTSRYLELMNKAWLKRRGTKTGVAVLRARTAISSMCLIKQRLSWETPWNYPHVYSYILPYMITFPLTVFISSFNVMLSFNWSASICVEVSLWVVRLNTAPFIRIKGAFDNESKCSFYLPLSSLSFWHFLYLLFCMKVCVIYILRNPNLLESNCRLKYPNFPLATGRTFTWKDRLFDELQTIEYQISFSDRQRQYFAVILKHGNNDLQCVIQKIAQLLNNTQKNRDLKSVLPFSYSNNRLVY